MNFEPTKILSLSRPFCKTGPVGTAVLDWRSDDSGASQEGQKQ
jgi:hypothetical protein